LQSTEKSELELAVNTAINKLENEVLTAEEQDIVNVKALLDGIELLFNTRLHREFLSYTPLVQDFKSALPYVQSLASERARIEHVTHSTGCYSNDQLNTLFSHLENQLNENNINEPIALSMIANGHVVAVGYNPGNQTWRFIDPNKPPSITYSSHKELVNAIMTGFAAS